MPAAHEVDRNSSFSRAPTTTVDSVQGYPLQPILDLSCIPVGQPTALQDPVNVYLPQAFCHTEVKRPVSLPPLQDMHAHAQ